MREGGTGDGERSRDGAEDGAADEDGASEVTHRQLRGREWCKRANRTHGP